MRLFGPYGCRGSHVLLIGTRRLRNWVADSDERDEMVAT